MGSRGLFVFACALLLSLGVLRVPASSRQAGTARSSPPGDVFATSVKPFLQTYCYGCHSANHAGGGFDLTSYATQDSVIGDQRHWNLVLTRLKAGEMPPSQSRQQPTPGQRQSVIDWIERTGAEDAKRHPNDPGVVLARRLSNAEYDYTIRDLTGVDIRPTREFPVDPANQAGFDNSGESLAMSPALVKKYLDAARVVADHVLFLPSGLSFAPYPVVTDQDRDKYGVNPIVDFSKRHPLDYADNSPPAWRLEARWKSLPLPADRKEPEGLRQAVGWMRDLIIDLRPRVAMSFDNLPARGIAAGSQSLVLWKDRQYADHRTTYPGNALKLDMSAYGPT